MEIPSQVLKVYYTKVDVEKHIVENQLYDKRKRHKRYIQYETDGLNEFQRFLYIRAMNGLAAYEPAELKTMKTSTRKWIEKMHNRTQKILNMWKQEITNDITNRLLDIIWTGKDYGMHTKANIIDSTRNYIDPHKKNKLSFKDLGIKKQDIINKLISEKILPNNFYELKPKT